MFRAALEGKKGAFRPLTLVRWKTEGPRLVSRANSYRLLSSPLGSPTSSSPSWTVGGLRHTSSLNTDGRVASKAFQHITTAAGST